jgi:hypothetical protein
MKVPHSKGMRRTLECLKGTGLPFEIKPGGSHFKVYVAGKMVGVLSYCGNSGARRDTREIETRIRQRAEELQHAHN